MVLHDQGELIQPRPAGSVLRTFLWSRIALRQRTLYAGSEDGKHRFRRAAEGGLAVGQHQRPFDQRWMVGKSREDGGVIRVGGQVEGAEVSLGSAGKTPGGQLQMRQRLDQFGQAWGCVDVKVDLGPNALRLDQRQRLAGF